MLHYRNEFSLGMAVALITLVSGCGSDSTSPPVPAGASAVGGADLIATVGTAVGTLQLRVVDEAGSPLSGISVAWSVTSGGGSVSPASSTTDANGIAQTTWTLGPTAGAQTVTGTVSGLPAVTFNATAEPGAASQVIVSPSTITLDALGATGQFSATVADANGNPIAGGTMAWSSSTVGVATVSTTGAAEAVSNGTSTITATSGEFEGTAVVTVLQTAATVAVTSPTENVEIGKTVQLTATASDANGNPLTDPELSWSSSDPAVATIDATGLVTGVTEGAATFTATAGSASGTADLTVILVLPPFEPVGNMDLTGTVDASEVIIPAGVTITATGPLTINASGNVQIDGAIMGDCVAVTINGSANVVVTGVVDNGCTGLVGEESPGLTIVGGGEMTFDGAVLTSTGDINLGNDLAALAAGGAILTPSMFASSTAQADGPCTFRLFAAGISENDGLSGNDGITNGVPGQRGADITVRCNGDVSLLGTNFEAGDAGTGGDADNPNGSATGGVGGPGGTLRISTLNGRLILENNNFLISGHGRKGGDASSGGDPARAEGGEGGNGGLFIINAGLGVTGSGTLDFFRGDGGDGGTARATGKKGADATASMAAGTAGEAHATGGRGGRVNGVFVSGFGAREATVNAPNAGNGGDALAIGEPGGDGSMEFPPGGLGPRMTARGGLGGVLNTNEASGTDVSGVNGKGGLARFLGGSGGVGWNACEKGFFRKGGLGGTGGFLRGGGGSVGTTTPGRPPGLPGETLVEGAANGGVSGDGIDPLTMGGPKGTNSLLPPDGTTAQITDSFEKGDDGELCKFNFNVGITVKADGDPNGHEEFIELTTVGMIMAQLLPGGQVEFTSGSILWIKTMGTVGANGSFSTSGVGTAAGIPGVPVTFNGTIVLDGEGKITEINGMLVYDSSNSVLPAQPPPPDGDGLQHPANYNLIGTFKPAT